MQPLALVGRPVTLEPLENSHHDELVAAVRDGGVRKLCYAAVPAPEEMGVEIERRLRLQEAGSMLPFVARRNADSVVLGTTTYMDIDAGLPGWSSARRGTGPRRAGPARTSMPSSCCPPMPSRSWAARPWSSAHIG